MVASKKTGFFWSEDHITLVESEKNEPLRIISSRLEQKDSLTSPFSSSFTEEIQVTVSLQNILQDSRIAGKDFFLSLPMKEIILRSFSIPFIKQDDLLNAVRFESKKYLPLDIQDLNFVFHTVPFTDENKVKRLQVIFFAVRKETMDRYDRIIKQVHGRLAYCEPWTISLAKILVSKKQIKPTDHVAFLILEKNSGIICFIQQGIPQFVREFSIGLASPTEAAQDVSENLKIVNEVGNSFDFYARQFNAESLGQVFVAGQKVDDALLAVLEAELKMKLKKFSSAKVIGPLGTSENLDAMYAWGACVTPSLPSQAKFNFFAVSKPKSTSPLLETIKNYKQVATVLGVCVLFLAGLSLLFQSKIKAAQDHLKHISFQEGGDAAAPLSAVQQDLQDNIDKLNSYKAVRTRSHINIVILKIASHLPLGTKLSRFDIQFNVGSLSDEHPAITLEGQVYKGDSNDEMAVINQISTDLKQDKGLVPYIKNVDVAALYVDRTTDNKPVTKFVIHCS